MLDHDGRIGKGAQRDPEHVPVLVEVAVLEGPGKVAGALGVPEAKRAPDYLEVVGQVSQQKPDDGFRFVNVGGAGNVTRDVLGHGGGRNARGL